MIAACVEVCEYSDQFKVVESIAPAQTLERFPYSAVANTIGNIDDPGQFFEGIKDALGDGSLVVMVIESAHGGQKVV